MIELSEGRHRARGMLHRTRTDATPADYIQREKQTPTPREFTRGYLWQIEPHWKPSGRRTMCIYLKARILHALGSMPLNRIAPEAVAVWFDAASKDRPGTANRALEILRAMMFRAQE